MALTLALTLTAAALWLARSLASLRSLAAARSLILAPLPLWLSEAERSLMREAADTEALSLALILRGQSQRLRQRASVTADTLARSLMLSEAGRRDTAADDALCGSPLALAQARSLTAAGPESRLMLRLMSGSLMTLWRTAPLASLAAQAQRTRTAARWLAPSPSARLPLPLPSAQAPAPLASLWRDTAARSLASLASLAPLPSLADTLTAARSETCLSEADTEALSLTAADMLSRMADRLRRLASAAQDTALYSLADRLITAAEAREAAADDACTLPLIITEAEGDALSRFLTAAADGTAALASLASRSLSPSLALITESN